MNLIENEDFCKVDFDILSIFKGEYVKLVLFAVPIKFLAKELKTNNLINLRRKAKSIKTKLILINTKKFEELINENKELKIKIKEIFEKLMKLEEENKLLKNEIEYLRKKVKEYEHVEMLKKHIENLNRKIDELTKERNDLMYKIKWLEGRIRFYERILEILKIYDKQMYNFVFQEALRYNKT